jgi:hypothetical protein
METIGQHWRDVENAPLVRNYFGKFPSLHDTEVVEIRLNRELGHDFTGPKLFLTMFVFDSVVAPDDPRRKKAKLSFVFSRVELSQLSGFNHQNPISDFFVHAHFCDRLKQNRWRIRFGENGFLMEFTCSAMRAESIAPFEPEDYFAKRKTNV